MANVQKLNNLIHHPDKLDGVWFLLVFVASFTTSFTIHTRWMGLCGDLCRTTSPPGEGRQRGGMRDLGLGIRDERHVLTQALSRRARERRAATSHPPLATSPTCPVQKTLESGVPDAHADRTLIAS